MAVQRVKTRGQNFVMVNFDFQGFSPVALMFSSRAADQVISNLQKEINVKGLSPEHPQTARLLTMALSRVGQLTSLVRDEFKAFAKIKSAIKRGGTGDKAAADLTKALELYRGEIQPELN